MIDLLESKTDQGPPPLPRVLENISKPTKDPLSIVPSYLMYWRQDSNSYTASVANWHAFCIYFHARRRNWNKQSPNFASYTNRMLEFVSMILLSLTGLHCWATGNCLCSCARGWRGSNSRYHQESSKLFSILNKLWELLIVQKEAEVSFMNFVGILTCTRFRYGKYRGMRGRTNAANVLTRLLTRNTMIPGDFVAWLEILEACDPPKIHLVLKYADWASSHLRHATVSMNPENWQVFSFAGTKRISYLEENLKSLEVKLTKTEIDELHELVPEDKASFIALQSDIEKWLAIFAFPQNPDLL